MDTLRSSSISSLKLFMENIDYEYLQCTLEERNILKSWNIHIHAHTPVKEKGNHSNSPTRWTPPPPGFIKINIDGASRGNPGPTGFDLVLRNHTGEIIHLVAGFLGENTNNVADLLSLI